ncbi:MAG: CYTH domain-containing protein [Chloroflexota bacterium]|nr:CYTH domain-containing protein [Chloroflexota bacterium]
MIEPREIEAKFDVDRQDRDLLLSITTVGRFTVQEQRTAAQDDIYFDTSGALLAEAGSTLRVRRTAKGARMTYKGLRESGGPSGEAHIASRLEDEVSLDTAQASAVAIDLPLPDMEGISPLERARSVVGHDVLLPVARLQNTRTTLLLSDANGATLELAVDDCVGTRLSDGRKIEFDEVELETKTADRVGLLDASSALRELVPSLRPSPLTKLGRTLD